MRDLAIEMNGMNEFAIGACSMTLLSFAVAWYHNRKKEAEKRKLAEKILTSPKTSWMKVGSVKEIYCYPLKSGKAKVVDECTFDECGLSVNHGASFMKDRMFLAYNEVTGKFQTGRDYPKLLLIDLSLISNDQAKIEVDDMPPLIFELPKTNDKNTKIFNCVMWFNENVECIDCGDAVSKWFSRFLTGSDTGIRLGICNPQKQRILDGGPWEQYTKVYSTLRNEDTGLFSDLTSYMVLSEASVDDLNRRLAKSIPPRQLRPNIVVEGCDPFAEDDWEWIRIGDEAVVRNVKPCTRCSMTRIDPDTGVADPLYEPLKTLRTYRKLKDPERDALESHAPAIGVYCGLYHTGKVKVGDDVLIYQEDNKSKS